MSHNQLKSTSKMVVNYVSVLVSLLPFAASLCLPLDTPWTSMCDTKCVRKYGEYRRDVVAFLNCGQTTLPSRSYSDKREIRTLVFVSSGITDISRDAFSGYTALKLFFRYSFVKFESEAFGGLSVNEIHINDNTELISLPSRVFLGVSSLKILNLADNKLQSLPADIFLGLIDIEFLNVAGNFISCFAQDLFQPLQSVNHLYINQSVDMSGLCSQSFKGLGLKVHDYEDAVDRCVIECSIWVHNLEIIDKDKTCDCYSHEGCLDCTGGTRRTRGSNTKNDMVKAPLAGGVSKNEAVRMTFPVSLVLIMINVFDY